MKKHPSILRPLGRLGRFIAAAAVPALVAAASLSSCDNSIDLADRLIEENDTVDLDEGKNVLVMDFTGQRCVNCPLANDEIHLLQETYGADRVIAVGIHSGPLGLKPSRRNVGLATDEGDAYYNQWNIEAQPMGIIDYNGPYNYDAWMSVVRTQLAQAKTLDIDVESTLTDDASTLSGTVTLHSLRGELAGRLQLWLIEDSITALQMLPGGGVNREYNHMHVYRKAINATDGQAVSASEGEPTAVDFSTSVDATWRPAQLWVVAFVYDAHGVVQVVRKKVVD